MYIRITLLNCWWCAVSSPLDAAQHFLLIVSVSIYTIWLSCFIEKAHSMSHRRLPTTERCIITPPPILYSVIVIAFLRTKYSSNWVHSSVRDLIQIPALSSRVSISLRLPPSALSRPHRLPSWGAPSTSSQLAVEGSHPSEAFVGLWRPYLCTLMTDGYNWRCMRWDMRLLWSIGQ